MKISQKLSLIVVLTALEISLTIWAAFQISKGATFHQLNSLHLKYNGELGEILRTLPADGEVPVGRIRETLVHIRDQPEACLREVNAMDEFVMQRIGTHYALGLCQKDIGDANRALNALRRYESGASPRRWLVSELVHALGEFRENSTRFERPITKTVSFTLTTMIPLVLAISLFNIVFITLLSRAISGSLRGVIDMLNRKHDSETLQKIRANASGEISDLLSATEERLRRELWAGELNEKLEKEVTHRTASLQRANDELAQFAYRASHDLKGPLTTTLSLLRMAGLDLDAGDIEEARRIHSRVEGQLEKLEKLVVDILELARADLDEVDTEPVRLRECIEEVRTYLEREASESGVSLRCENIDIEPFLTHRVRLIQILQNLISNGIKYRDPEAGAPTVGVVAKLEEGSLMLTVEDNGLGIPKQYHNKVFTRFKRFHPNAASGSGLGLAIVQRHTEAVGGSVSFESAPGRTRFTIELPVQRAA